MSRKVVYPEADPAHLCGCECHAAGNSVDYFDGCACCDTCACGRHIKYPFWEEHKDACVPRKDRHKLREG